jgi:hypothetical protein
LASPIAFPATSEAIAIARRPATAFAGETTGYDYSQTTAKGKTMSLGNGKALQSKSERLLTASVLCTAAMRLTQSGERKVIGNIPVMVFDRANLSIWHSTWPDAVGVDVWISDSGKSRKVLNVRWSEDGEHGEISVISFRRGDWERELLSQVAHVSQQAA